MWEEDCNKETTYIFKAAESPLCAPEAFSRRAEQENRGLCGLPCMGSQYGNTPPSLVCLAKDLACFSRRFTLLTRHVALHFRRELTTVPSKSLNAGGGRDEPQILYDLFGTVNHRGNLQSGHYVTNVKVGSQWFRCNDQHVSSSNEAAVLTSNGAYILFYARR